MKKLSANVFFSGIGMQERGIQQTALFDLDVMSTSEIDKDAVVSYATIHCGLTKELIETYDSYPSREQMAAHLTDIKLGYDFIKDKEYDWFKKINSKTKDLEKYWLASHLSKNLGDISKIKEVGYADLWTYSFPCTDISAAGKQKGLVGGTRSGLLYEVERLLQVSKNNNTMPKFLLLENVKQLVGTKFIDSYRDWNLRLDELGYNTYYEVMNAKDYGVPQTRERVFAVSIRKDIDTKKFIFPRGFDSGVRLKDILDANVGEKYYLKQLKEFFVKHSIDSEKQGNGFRFKPHNPTSAQIAFTVTTRAGSRMDDNFINATDLCDDSFFEFTEKNLDNTFKAKRLAGLFDEIKSDENGERVVTHQAGSIWNKEGLAPTLDTMAGGWRHPMVLEEFLKMYRVRRLTPGECFVLMGLSKSDCDKCSEVGVADTQLYKQSGNGLVTNCVEYIMKELYRAQYDDSYSYEVNF